MRIGLGLTNAWFLARAYADLDSLYASSGCFALPSLTLESPWEGTANIHTWYSTRQWAHTIWWASLACSAAFACGLCTRVATVLLWY